MNKLWKSCEKDMDKSWKKNEKFTKNMWTINEKVISHEQVIGQIMKKSWINYEQAMDKS